MVFPLVVALSAVLLGALFALGPREGAVIVRPIRLVAIGASLVVIATHLAPEAFRTLGLSAIAGVVLGAAFPAAAEFVGARLAASATVSRDGGARVGLEAAYGGLVLHRFGDGLSMGAAAGSPTVVLAVALHIVPVTTVMLLAVEGLLGRRAAVTRAMPLAIATMAGVVAAGVAVKNAEGPLAAWISAAVAGLLLHVAAHDVPRHRPHHAR